ncbi:acrosin-like [Hyla sarda]|uniref:acrosin-like n=1 Tax=Hyla sarda TaxID=327740 RepID=UPI0024C325B6|nr:acrosin-like [Hyla sarda]
MKLLVLLQVTAILLCQFMDHGALFPHHRISTPLACGDRPLAGQEFGSRIVGGKDALPGSWPWLVSIQQAIDEDHFVHVCGGSILNDKWILTAAHCFKNQADSVFSWRLVFGGHKLSASGPEVQIRAISKKIEHENYDPDTERNDIALLSIDRPISYNEHIQPACLPPKTAQVPLMTDCYIAGWGVLEEEATEPSDILQEARVDLISTKRCNSTAWYNGAVGVYNLCAGYEKGGIDSCQGDSGGPLMCKEPKARTYSVVGITSWGSGCAQAQSPGIYTSTQYFLNWIMDKTESNPTAKKRKLG